MKPILRTLLQMLWHTSRYGLAIGVTVCALSVLPVLAILMVAIVGMVFMLLTAFVMLAGLVIGGSDFPMGTLMMAAVALVLSGVIPVAALVAIILAIAAVLLFIGLCIFPVSLLVEIILRQARIRSPLAQMAGFIIAGGLAGLAIGALGGWVAVLLQADWQTMGITGGALFLLCGVSSSLFGLVLTMSEATRAILGKVATRVSPQLRLATALDGSEDAALRHADGESVMAAAADQALQASE